MRKTDQYSQTAKEEIARGDYQAAIEQYQKILAAVKPISKSKLPNKDKDSARIYFNIGTCYQQLQKYPEAKKIYLESLRLDKEFIDSRFGLLDVLNALGEFDQAFQLASKIYNEASDKEHKIPACALSLQLNNQDSQKHPLSNIQKIEYVTIYTEKYPEKILELTDLLKSVDLFEFCEKKLLDYAQFKKWEKIATAVVRYNIALLYCDTKYKNDPRWWNTGKARTYLENIFTDQSLNKTYVYYSAAATLGMFCDEAVYGMQDKTKALQYYLIAMQGNIPGSHHNVALGYEENEWGVVDLDLAEKYYRQSVAINHQPSIINLAALLAKKNEMVEAKKLYELHFSFDKKSAATDLSAIYLSEYLSEYELLLFTTHDSIQPSKSDESQRKSVLSDFKEQFDALKIKLQKTIDIASHADREQNPQAALVLAFANFEWGKNYGKLPEEKEPYLKKAEESFLFAIDQNLFQSYKYLVTIYHYWQRKVIKDKDKAAMGIKITRLLSYLKFNYPEEYDGLQKIEQQQKEYYSELVSSLYSLNKQIESIATNKKNPALDRINKLIAATHALNFKIVHVARIIFSIGNLMNEIGATLGLLKPFENSIESLLKNYQDNEDNFDINGVIFLIEGLCKISRQGLSDTMIKVLQDLYQRALNATTGLDISQLGRLVISLTTINRHFFDVSKLQENILQNFFNRLTESNDTESDLSGACYALVVLRSNFKKICNEKQIFPVFKHCIKQLDDESLRPSSKHAYAITTFYILRKFKLSLENFLGLAEIKTKCKKIFDEDSINRTPLISKMQKRVQDAAQLCGFNNLTSEKPRNGFYMDISLDDDTFMEVNGPNHFQLTQKDEYSPHANELCRDKILRLQSLEEELSTQKTDKRYKQRKFIHINFFEINSKSFHELSEFIMSKLKEFSVEIPKKSWVSNWGKRYSLFQLNNNNVSENKKITETLTYIKM